jgi:hypothetical protein
VAKTIDPKPMIMLVSEFPPPDIRILSPTRKSDCATTEISVLPAGASAARVVVTISKLVPVV